LRSGRRAVRVIGRFKADITANLDAHIGAGNVLEPYRTGYISSRTGPAGLTGRSAACAPTAATTPAEPRKTFTETSD
jgi:hypothetical protein